MAFIRRVCSCWWKIQTRALTQAHGPYKQTTLNNFHVAHGAKMVPFAGWSMPVQYSDLSIVESVLHTRQKASVFDVSHMLQIDISGKDAKSFLEYILVADVSKLRIGSGSYSLITTPKGGIVDDCILTRTGEASFYLVSNAGRAEADLAHIQEHLTSFKGGSSDVSVVPLMDKSLIALQGPTSSLVLQTGIEGDLSTLKFMNSAVIDVFGIPNCRVSRCGYTGEDGFEISVDSSHVLSLTEKLLSAEGGMVKLAGLGARDILRLEAGLCLYGNDISEETSPVEAGLAWCISKRRRSEGGFIGAETILKQLKGSPSKKRVGLLVKSAPARSNYAVLDVDNTIVGKITSGSPSPSLETNIAMAYVPFEFSKPGTLLKVQIRKNLVNSTVVRMPFIPLQYFN